MSVLFDRFWRVTFQDELYTYTWDKIDLSFRVVKTSDNSPNTLDLSIFNLNPDSRAFISRKNMRVTLEAGYKDVFGVIFKGNVETPQHSRSQTDWITSVQALDGALHLRNVNLSRSYEQGTDLNLILNDMLSEITDAVIPGAALAAIMGVSQGLTDTGSKLSGKQVKRTKVLHGNVMRELDDFLKSYNLRRLINDGTIHIISNTEPLDLEVIALNQNSGMLGTPEPLDEKSGYRVRSLLRHEFNPGVQVSLDSKSGVGGQFVIDTVEHVGGTRSNEWYSEIEVSPL